MTGLKFRWPTISRPILLALLGLAVVYLGSGFIHQARVRQQQQAQLDGVNAEIAAARQLNDELQQHLEFVESPEAVERWALENLWARPEEQIVVLVGPEGEEATPGGRPGDPAANSPSPSEAWWDLFFGERQP